MAESFNITYSKGYLIFIEGNDPSGNEWWHAHEWQKKEFLKVMRFGEMKSMGGSPPTTEETEPFYKDGFMYKFIIENEWGPCYLHNITTNKKRLIKYIYLGHGNDTFPDDTEACSNIYITKY